MKEYLNLVYNTLLNGNYKQNRTGIDTISTFSQSYTINLSEGFPLLTTKNMGGYRWQSLVHELKWYLSGEEHIRNLRENTQIWDAWADENGHLDTAYGRFWRRYPIPSKNAELPGETWPTNNFQGRWGGDENIDSSRWVKDSENGGKMHFDQLQYVVDMLEENPESRRLVVNAWHPANATISTLPPCHFAYVLNVQNGKLNCHLTQRSGDIALGVPFNIASYSILTHLLANQVGLEVGKFSHTIVDAHIYCGDGRGEYYKKKLKVFQNDIYQLGRPINEEQSQFAEQADYIEENAPTDEDNKDHVPGLLRQISRQTHNRPTLEIDENATINNFKPDHLNLKQYSSQKDIKFGVAE